MHGLELSMLFAQMAVALDLLLVFLFLGGLLFLLLLLGETVLFGLGLILLILKDVVVGDVLDEGSVIWTTAAHLGH